MPSPEYGLVIPPHVTGNPEEVLAFAQEAEKLHFRFLAPYYHSGRGEKKEGDLYGHETPFPDPLILLMAIAGKTNEIRLFPTVLVLPQLQTVETAKNVATLDFLTQGRVDLGVGVGWNQDEYDAGGIDFNRRGKRLDEQIPVLRQLWTGESVTATLRTVDTAHEDIKGISLNPLPQQQPIPIWIAGKEPKAVKRAALLGDGYMKGEGKSNIEQQLELLRKTLETEECYVRDPSQFGIMLKVSIAQKTSDEVKRELEDTLQYNPTKVIFNANTKNIRPLDEYLEEITKLQQFLGI